MEVTANQTSGSRGDLGRPLDIDELDDLVLLFKTKEYVRKDEVYEHVQRKYSDIFVQHSETCEGDNDLAKELKKISRLVSAEHDWHALVEEHEAEYLSVLEKRQDLAAKELGLYRVWLKKIKFASDRRNFIRGLLQPRGHHYKNIQKDIQMVQNLIADLRKAKQDMEKPQGRT